MTDGQWMKINQGVGRAIAVIAVIARSVELSLSRIAVGSVVHHALLGLPPSPGHEAERVVAHVVQTGANRQLAVVKVGSRCNVGFGRARTCVVVRPWNSVGAVALLTCGASALECGVELLQARSSAVVLNGDGLLG